MFHMGLSYHFLVIDKFRTLVEWYLEGKRELHAENLAQGHFVQLKSFFNGPYIEIYISAPKNQQLNVKMHSDYYQISNNMCNLYFRCKY